MVLPLAAQNPVGSSSRGIDGTTVSASARSTARWLSVSETSVCGVVIRYSFGTPVTPEPTDFHLAFFARGKLRKLSSAEKKTNRGNAWNLCGTFYDAWLGG